jgi:hypothetical protein
MTAEIPEQRAIAIIDLRKVDPAEVTSRRFHEVQAERAPGGDWGKVDFTRIVVVDHVRNLAEHGEVFTHILDSGVDVSVLCIAVGELSDGDRAIAIRRPYQLRAPWAATLWVSDPDGIRWNMESSQADEVYQRSSRHPDEMLPAPLTESVGLSQVFDRVLHSVGEMPGAVASPGIYVNHSDVIASALSKAQQTAIKSLVGPSVRVPQQGALVDPAGLVGGAGDVPARAEAIKPGSQIDQLYRKCQQAASMVNAAAERLDRPAGLMSDAGPQLRAALGKLAESAREFVEIADRAFDWADPRTAFDAMHVEELSQYGIEIPKSPPQATAAAVSVLSEETINAVDRHQPLPAIAEQLRDGAERVAPGGTQQYLAQLRRLCPDTTFRSLTKLRPVVGVGRPWLVPVTALAGLIAGLWPSPPVLTGAIEFLASTGLAMWIIAQAAEIADADEHGKRRFIALYPGALAVGAVIGIVLSLFAKLPTPAGLAGAVIGVALAIVLAMVLAGAWWKVLFDDWLRASGVTTAVKLPNRLRSLVTEAAVKEWQPAAERRAVSDWARIMAGIVDDVTSGLTAYAADLSNAELRAAVGEHEEGAESPADANIRDTEILTVVLIDLTDAVVSVLDRLFAPLRAGSFLTPNADAVSRAVKQQLVVYSNHLLTRGIHAAPPFGRESDERTQNVDALLERSIGIDELIWSTTTDDRIVQLCAPRHLTLLERDAGSAEMIRFAPRSAQEFAARKRAGHGIGQNEQVGKVEWTATSRVSGVLRLVPLRPDAVDEVVASGQSAAVESASQFSAADWPASPGDDDD